jgi:general secretion pathway protein H
MDGRRAERGFTLLELLLVLVVAAASYALVLRVSAGGASGAEIKSAARTVAAGLRDARGTAIATQESAALLLDLEHRSMEVSGGRASRTLPQRLDVKLYTAQSEIVDEKHGAIRFYPDGSSTGGRVTISSGERKLLVDVDWLTGRVSIKEGG